MTRGQPAAWAVKCAEAIRLDLIAKTQWSQWDAGSVLARDVAALIDSHARPQIAAALMRERERCAKAVCSCCAKGEPHVRRGSGALGHQALMGEAHECKAAAILEDQ